MEKVNSIKNSRLATFKVVGLLKFDWLFFIQRKEKKK